MTTVTKHQHAILKEMETNHLIDYHGFPMWENGSSISMSRTTIEKLAGMNLIVCDAHPKTSRTTIYYKMTDAGRIALLSPPSEPRDRPLTSPQFKTLRLFWFNRVLRVVSGRLEWVDCDNCKVPRSDTIARLLALGLVDADINVPYGNSVLMPNNEFRISEHGRELVDRMYK